MQLGASWGCPARGMVRTLLLRGLVRLLNYEVTQLLKQAKGRARKEFWVKQCFSRLTFRPVAGSIQKTRLGGGYLWERKPWTAMARGLLELIAYGLKVLLSLLPPPPGYEAIY